MVMAALIDGLSGIEGVHITVRHELPEPSARLMATLGVIVTVDPAAPECERGLNLNGDVAERNRRCHECVRVEREGRTAA